MVSIAHWLDTFTCSKYADRFERSGYQNIHSVCRLTIAQLQSLGVANNDIYTIMDNITLLKQSLKSLTPTHYLDLNSEPPTSTTRSRTASPAINTINRTMSQNPTAYSPGPNVSTPPTSSGPSPDRILPGPPTFDTPTSYHRSNSYANPVNPNTFFDVSPSSSTSSPHRSTSIDALPPQMEPPPFNDYHPQPPPPLSSHQFQPPGMMYRGINPPGGGYYSPHLPRFYSPDPQQQHFVYPNQRMMMHPQQHPPWGGHRPSLPQSMSSHPMHYHPYEQHQYRMPPSQQFCHPNHPMMPGQNPMFINQPPPSSQQQTMNSSTSNKLSNAGESHPHPLQSLERLVLLPESQVIDPKSVVNEIHDPQSPFSESLSPYGTSSPKNSVSTPPNTTIVSNLLTNDKSTLEQHARTSGGLKRSSTHDERSDLNKKNRMNTTNDMNTGDSIISNHPVVTSLLTRGLSTPTSQAPLPSIKSLQQKHNPSFLQQQQQQQSQSMMFSSNQPDTQPFVDGSIDNDDGIHCKVEYIEQDYEELLTKLRSTLNKSSADKIRLSSNTIVVSSQLDGVSESPSTTPKSSTRTSRKRDLSTSSERGTSNSENRSCSPVKVQLDKSNSDTVSSSSNGIEKRRNGSLDHHKSSKRRLSENNFELNSSINGHHSNSVSSKIQKPKVIQSPTHSNLDDDQSSSSSNSAPQRRTTTELSSKPIREAKKRSLIYTGNTRLFLETAIAAGLMEDNGDEEDEDNEYVPPGGTVLSHSKRPLPSSSSSSSSASSSESEDESAKSAGENSSNSEDESDDNEEEEEEEEDEAGEDAETSDNNDEDRKKSSDEIVVDEEPSESGVNWNVKNRPQRRSHLVRFDNISKEDEQKFFGALEEQVPELSAYLNDNSDDEYQLDEKEPSDNVNKPIRRSSSKKSQRNLSRDDPEQDEQTVEIIKKFRHVNVPPKRRSTKKKAHSNETATISAKNRSDELYVIANDDVTHRIVPGTHLETSASTKKNLTVQSFYFPRRQVKMNPVEDFKAPWHCILCWKEPYENYLGPLFGPFPLNEQYQGYVQNNKQLPKHYRKLKEVWLHRDCALWNNHIQMNSSTGELMHVSDACMTYLDITCSACKIPGAALACRYRNCKIRYHYSCAKTTVDSRLIEESYSVYCPKHNQMNNNKLKKARAKSTTGIDDCQESSMI
ncbi:unnamed protein product [Adineta ricciae]|uniref:PHD-type domain-containing protein n=1 Tax=Adineta ricciae TaxID=249248 RepID=A0A815W6M8_ADIRI|nr:unnamed protein product [Adineta ricciae]CAF1539809.1 unnamed protein product [Adineta ricciae]